MATIQPYQNMGSGDYFLEQCEYYQKQFIAEARKNNPELNSLSDTELMKHPTVSNNLISNPLAPVWSGGIASHLGLEGKLVLSDEFQKACAGYTPDSDLSKNPTKLNSNAFDVENGKIVPGEEDRRVGTEILLTLSKELSVLMACASPEEAAEIRKLINEVITETLIPEIENHAIIRKNGLEQKADGILVATFNHIENRGAQEKDGSHSHEKGHSHGNEDGNTPEPFGHTHLVVMNTAYCAEDNKYYSLTNDEICKNKAHLNSLYSMGINEKLRKRGYELEAKYSKVDAADEFKKENSKEVLTLVPKVDPRLVELYSKRKSQIDEVAAENGSSGAAAKSIAQKQTKNNKSTATATELQQHWRDEIKEVLGLDHNYIESLKTHKQAHLVGISKGAPTDDELIKSFYDSSKEIASSEGQIKAFFKMKLFEYSNMETASKDAERIFNSHFQAVMDKNSLTEYKALIDKPESMSIEQMENSQIKFTKNLKFIAKQKLAEEKRAMEFVESSRNSTHFQLSSQLVTEQLRKYHEGKSFELKPGQILAISNATTQTGNVAKIEGYAGSGKSTLAEVIVSSYLAANTPDGQKYKVIGVGTSQSNTKNLGTEAGISEYYNSAKLLELLDAGANGNPKGLKLDSKTVLMCDEFGMADGDTFTRMLKYVEDSNCKMIVMGQSTQLKAVGASGLFEEISNRQINTSIVSDVNRQVQDWQREATKMFSEGKGDSALKKYCDEGYVHFDKTQGDSFDKAVSCYLADKNSHSDKILITNTNAAATMINNRVREALKKQGTIHGPAIKIKCGDEVEREFQVGDKIAFTRNRSKKNDVINNESGFVTGIDTKKNEMTFRNDEGKIKTIKMVDGLHIAGNFATTINKSQGQTKKTAYFIPTDNGSLNKTYVAMSRHKEGAYLFLNEELKRKCENKIKHTAPTESMMKTAEYIAAEKKIEIPKDTFDSFATTRRFLNSHAEYKIDGLKSHPMDEYKDFLIASVKQEQKKTTFDYQSIDRDTSSTTKQIGDIVKAKQLERSRKIGTGGEGQGGENIIKKQLADKAMEAIRVKAEGKKKDTGLSI